jgi:anhydro-N-acetylmuramic acid kinase
MLAIGLMSGTSLDGIDAAIVDIKGMDESTEVKLLHFGTFPFTDAQVNRIKSILPPNQGSTAEICSLNFELGELFAYACIKICKSFKVDISKIDFIASHGLTAYHIPELTDERKGVFHSTLQIGEPAVIAELTECKVVSNLRSRDMAAGGQGAPIVPYSEFIMYKSSEKLRLLLNIGGIANVTVLPKNADFDKIVAFDTGPGNMIINAIANRFFGKEYDKGGAFASSGSVNEKLLSELMSHPYIKASFPKTTGREMFGEDFIEPLIEKYKSQISHEDFIASVTAFTAKSIAENLEPFVEEGVTELIVGGGGSYNSRLLQYLKEYIEGAEVLTQEDLGFSSEAKEAIAMAVIGNQTLHNSPSNVPSATGAKKAVKLGSITEY